MRLIRGRVARNLFPILILRFETAVSGSRCGTFRLCGGTVMWNFSPFSCWRVGTFMFDWGHPKVV